VRRLALVSALIGCSAPPPVERAPLEFTIPDAWAAGTAVPGAEPDARPWWQRFGDPSVASVVEEALRRNHDLRAAAARVERAIAEARVAGADRLPQISAAFDAARDRQSFVGFPFGGALTTTRFRAGLDLRWELDLWGRLAAAERAALADAEAAAADLAGAWLSLSGQAARSWFAFVEADRQLELARATLASYRETARYVRDRYETGVGSQLDRRLADANAAAAEALLAERSAVRERAARNLEALLGRYPTGEVVAGPALPEPGPDVPRGLPSDLVRRRPDVAAAERRVTAALARGDAARGALYPRIALTASGGTISEDLSDLLDGDARIWSLAGNLLQPIFEGGRLRARIDASDAGTRESLASFADVVLQAYVEVESALAVETFLRDRERHLDTAASESRAGRELAEDRYRAGAETLLVVLEAQRRELDHESLRLAARRIRLDTRVDLHLALGGGFDAAPDPPNTDETETDARRSEQD
jgi:NodT family efflux transporter outer membrane factor (OMF) lipoprotein